MTSPSDDANEFQDHFMELLTHKQLKRLGDAVKAEQERRDQRQVGTCPHCFKSISVGNVQSGIGQIFGFDVKEIARLRAYLTAKGLKVEDLT